MKILMSDKEQEALRTLIQKYNPHFILEIGSYQGGSLAIFREECPHAYITTIEPNPSQFIYDLKANQIELIPEYTPRAFDYLHQKYDFIFIDGNHSYSNVLNDIIHSVKYLNENGVILCHDSKFDEVNRAICDAKDEGYILDYELICDSNVTDAHGNNWGGLTLLHIKQDNKIEKWGRRLEYRVGTFDLLILREMDTQYNEVDYSKAKVVIDIGAQAGYYVNKVKALNPSTNIIAIEMANDNFELLKKNTNDLKGVKLIHAALAYRSNFKAIRWMDGNTGSGRLLPLENENPKGTDILPISLERITIEDIFDKYKLKSVDIVKMDCEGSEWDIFENISTQITSKIKYIIGEYHGQADFAKLHLDEFCEKHIFGLKNFSNTNGLGFFLLENLK